jgi:hypothetical protein
MVIGQIGIAKQGYLVAFAGQHFGKRQFGRLIPNSGSVLRQATQTGVSKADLISLKDVDGRPSCRQQ